MGGEHDAEDEQHERAADVDHQLHRADELGTSKKEQAGGGTEREDEIEGHADDVVGRHDRNGKPAGQPGKQEEED